jgi:putative ABC transport system permease protein
MFIQKLIQLPVAIVWHILNLTKKLVAGFVNFIKFLIDLPGHIVRLANEIIDGIPQVPSVTAMNIRNMTARKTSSMVAVIGIAGVVAILVGVLSMREGFRATLDLSGAEDVAIIMRAGANSEMSSGLGLDQTRLIADAKAVAQKDGKPVASPELYVVVDVPTRSTGTSANVPLRGVGSQASDLRQHFKITSGRMFIPGKFEVIVGHGAAVQFAGLEVGRKLHWGTTDWDVVGEFDDAGGVSESEIWTDATVLQGAYNRGTSYQSVRVKLTSPAAIQSLKDELTTNPQLNVRILSESDYYSEQSRSLSIMVTTVGYTVAILMGLGAIFSALNTMYSAVSARTREIATLRALGFGRFPILVSVINESVVLGGIGGIVGCAIAYIGFNGIRASTLNFTSFSQITFAFSVTPALLVSGLSYALLLSVIGGIMPGFRAAKMPIVSGLREL